MPLEPYVLRVISLNYSEKKRSIVNVYFTLGKIVNLIFPHPVLIEPKTCWSKYGGRNGQEPFVGWMTIEEYFWICTKCNAYF